MNHSSDLLHELADAIIGATARTKTVKEAFSSTNKWNLLGKLVSPRNATCIFLFHSGFLQKKCLNPICYWFDSLSPDFHYMYVFFILYVFVSLWFS